MGIGLNPQPRVDYPILEGDAPFIVSEKRNGSSISMVPKLQAREPNVFEAMPQLHSQHFLDRAVVMEWRNRRFVALPDWCLETGKDAYQANPEGGQWFRRP
jgi:hypothetical protein